MNSIELIKKLSNANGVSGFEDEVTELKKKLLGKDYPVYEDKIRNLYINNIEKTREQNLLLCLMLIQMKLDLWFSQ